ncbi:NAD(P)/FAD-dependent oxidoreductase [Streptomonospora sp. S1-112]|uniref:NAD(P)/FAD-dependent oxidoreductase n=1 Tax=Streptomonospora mangrovi TaxID=2883123 RepID=A0A9X3NTI0_9ACTN|nr:NAD(P)/FAD-dependent oxidoreductase [Streptomonospora mangrovi]MDA0563901.1 NAD(P)/FAD-dependent oxidoreductase [Streptomonospora mangrovi]
MYDAVIVGGGPAGMAAALALGRVHRTVLLIDSGEGRNAPAAHVHNFLTRDGTPPGELRAIGRRELAAYPGVEVRSGAVADLARAGADGTVDAAGADGAAEPRFSVVLAGGDRADARRVLLATGLADDLPGPRGVEALWGRSAFHCPYCHGHECAGRRVAVLGAAPPRVRLALQLSRFAAEVVLCTGGEPLDADARAALAAAGAAVRCEPVVCLEGTGGQLEQVAFEGGAPLAADAVFVVNAPRQRSGLAARLGCAVFADGCVEVDELHRTSVPGVYAAGDMARRATLPVPAAAVAVAAGSGSVAGAAIDQDLLSADFGLPHPFPRAGSPS